MSRCHRDEPQAAGPADQGNTIVAATPNAANSTVLAGTSNLGAYLAGPDAAPETFAFDTALLHNLRPVQTTLYCYVLCDADRRWRSNLRKAIENFGADFELGRLTVKGAGYDARRGTFSVTAGTTAAHRLRS